MVLYLFSVFNTISDTTDSKKLGHKTISSDYPCPRMVKSWLPMSTADKISAINAQLLLISIKKEPLSSSFFYILEIR